MANAALNRNDKRITALGGVVGLVLAYAFVSRAIDTGSYWQYLACTVFFVLGTKLFIRTFKK